MERRARNSALKEQFGQSGGLALTNSTYYPTSYIYRSGQMVYLRCAGLAVKEIKAGTELTIAVEGAIPEKYRPHVNCIFFPVVTDSGRILRVSVESTGKITYTAQEDINVGAGINMHVAFHTGKAAF